MSDFEKGHSELRVYVKAIFGVTKRIMKAKNRLVGIHEYWMEIGLNDMAHDLLPFLDFGTPMLAFTVSDYANSN